MKQYAVCVVFDYSLWGDPTARYTQTLILPFLVDDIDLDITIQRISSPSESLYQENIYTQRKSPSGLLCPLFNYKDKTCEAHWDSSDYFAIDIQVISQEIQF